MSTRRQASKQASPAATPTPAENGANGGRNSVNLGPNDRLVGQLFIEGDLRVAGTVEDGAMFSGRVSMGTAAEGSKAEPKPTEPALAAAVEAVPAAVAEVAKPKKR